MPKDITSAISDQPLGPQRMSRADHYRLRAADVAAQIVLLPPAQKRGSLLQRQALLLLANVEDWVSAPRVVPFHDDYKLTPRAAPPPPKERAPRRKRRNKVEIAQD